MSSVGVEEGRKNLTMETQRYRVGSREQIKLAKWSAIKSKEDIGQSHGANACSPPRHFQSYP